MKYFKYFKKYILNKINEFNVKFILYKKYLEEEKIIFPKELLKFTDGKILKIRKLIIEFKEEKGFENEILFRTLLQEISLLNIEFDYRSASYQESKYSNTFNLDNLNGKDINYNRYSSKYIKKLEKYLLELYSLENSYNCLVTSSGMSAYTIIEGLILREIYKNGDEIFIPNYIYFETFEQISKLENLGLKIVYGKDKKYNKQDIVDYILKNKPKIVFLDIIFNTSDIKILDVDYILDNIEKNIDYDIHIVFDITMQGLENNFSKYTNINLLIYGSASKYLFNGLDISMMGFVFTKDNFSNSLERQRRNIGAILYDFQLLNFPLLGKEFYKNRLLEITKDVQYFYNKLKENKEFLKKYNIHYAGVKNIKQSFGGSIITINFNDYELRTKENYKKIIDKIIKEAKKENIAFIEGVSFGFSITRVSASDVMSKGELPFLRISIGPSYYNNIKGLTKIFLKVLNNYFIN